MQVVIDSLKGDRLDMKKRVLHFLISFVLVFAFLFGGLNFSIQADASSGKVKLSAKKLYMLTTHLKVYPSIEIKNYTGYVQWTIEDDSVADIVYREYGDTENSYTKSKTIYSNSKCFINPKSSGTTKITAEYDGGKITCKLYVSDRDEAEAKYIKTGKNPYKLSKDELKAAKAIKKSIKKMNKKKMNRVQKIRKVHEYIVKNCKYNYTAYYNQEMDFSDASIIGTMLKKTAVCEGYARTFRVYMLAMGIPCKYVCGVTTIGNQGDHAWNMVKCSDGKWYHIDVTWDDPDNGPYANYKYFLLTDKQMKESRKWNYKDYPKCKGKKYRNYYTQDSEYNSKTYW